MKTITIFAKKRTTKDGKKTFYSFITKLTKKDGNEVVATVKFPEDNAPDVESCPCNIDVERDAMNLSSKTITDDATGKVIDSKTLWVKKWNMSATPYVDTSLDDYDI